MGLLYMGWLPFNMNLFIFVSLASINNNDFSDLDCKEDRCLLIIRLASIQHNYMRCSHQCSLCLHDVIVSKLESYCALPIGPAQSDL